MRFAITVLIIVAAIMTAVEIRRIEKENSEIVRYSDFENIYSEPLNAHFVDDHGGIVLIINDDLSMMTTTRLIIKDEFGTVLFDSGKEVSDK